MSGPWGTCWTAGAGLRWSEQSATQKCARESMAIWLAAFSFGGNILPRKSVFLSRWVVRSPVWCRMGQWAPKNPIEKKNATNFALFCRFPHAVAPVFVVCATVPERRPRVCFSPTPSRPMVPLPPLRSRPRGRAASERKWLRGPHAPAGHFLRASPFVPARSGLPKARDWIPGCPTPYPTGHSQEPTPSLGWGCVVMQLSEIEMVCEERSEVHTRGWVGQPHRHRSIGSPEGLNPATGRESVW